MIDMLSHLGGCGARYSILDLISSGIFARRLVRVLSITQVLRSIMDISRPGASVHIQISDIKLREMVWRISDPLVLRSLYLVALPISSFVVTFLMIQFLQAAMRPSSWNHVSICTRSPLHMHKAFCTGFIRQRRYSSPP